MLLHDLKIALRHLWKNKVYSLINILGLAFGLAICLLIVLFVTDELSYDQYHAKADRTYRIHSRGVIGNHELDQAVVTTPLAGTVRELYPEVEVATRISNWMTKEGIVIRREGSDTEYRENRFFYADGNIFEVFDIPLLKGDPATALDAPNKIVLTQDTVRKYFGDQNPMGQVIVLEDGKVFNITGVARNVPTNSHWQWDFLASFSTDPQSTNPGWLTNITYTYVVLREGSSVEAFQKKLGVLAKSYVDPLWQSFVDFENFTKTGSYYEFYARPLTEIHLHSDVDTEIQPNGNITYVYLFSVVAALILLIACTNYINLATARSATRTKEIGMRKVLGAKRGRLIRQLLVESTFTSFLAALLAVVLAELLLPYFNNLASKALILDFSTGSMLIPLFVGGLFLVGLLAGLYPAFFLASFNPLNLLRGSLRAGMKSGILRKALIVVQFAITIGIITGTLVVFDQLSYFQNKKLGFNKEQIVVIKGVKYLDHQAPIFRDEIRKQSGVVSATVSSTVPGYFINHQVLLPDIRDKYEVGFVWGLFSDEYYADTYDLEMVTGTYLTGDPGRDAGSVVINETTARELEMDAPLERYLSIGGPPKNVIGVIRDFHYESLHSKIRPFSANHIGDNWTYYGKFISVRLHPGDIPGTLRAIEQQWYKFSPDEPFEYYFLDSNLEELYGAEQRTGRMFATFSIFAVLISCLGLFGLISYAAEQRTREIGIRKVLGATVTNIVILLANEIARLLLTAVIIAGPLAYFFMDNWLQNFSYRTDFHIGNFFIAAVIATVVALATVSFRAAKAAMANPAESLRYE